MAILIIILFILTLVAFFADLHALGIWLVMMIIHGFLVELMGDIARHLPMYSGLLILTMIFARRKWVGVQQNILVLFGLLIALMVIAALAGLDPENSMVKIFLYSKGFLLAILIAGTIKNNAQIQTLTLYCLVGIFIGVCLAYYQHFTGTYVIDSPHLKRVGGLSNDPNDTALLLLAGIPLTLYWGVHTKAVYLKLFFYAFFALIIGAVVLTQSRGGFVALCLLLLCIYLRKPTVVTTALGVVLVSVGLLFTPETYWERINTLVTGEERGRSLSGRMMYVERGVGAFMNNPALGVGMGNFGKAISITNSSAVYVGQQKTDHKAAHNMYLEFFVENGLIAGIIFLAIFSIALIQLIRYDKSNESEFSVYGIGFCLAMSLAAMLFAGLFLSQGKNSVLWFFVGLGLAAYMINQTLIKQRRFQYQLAKE